MRVIIIGGPRTGKTTMASTMPGPRSTDELVAKYSKTRDGWSLLSAEVASWFDAPGPWTIEGVATARALRKWHANHEGQRPPCDKVRLLTWELQPLTSSQASLARGVMTVFLEIAPWLGRWGVL